MKFREGMVASIVAAGVALTPCTAGTASASSYYSFPGGQAKFTSAGEILEVWDTKAGRTGVLVVVEDESAANPTLDKCHVVGKGRTKTCDMSFKNGHRLRIDAYSHTKLGNPDTYQLVATWKDKA